MMKNAVVLISLGVLIVCAPYAGAAEKKVKKQAQGTEAVSPERVKQEEQAKAAQILKGQEWVIYLSAPTGAKGKSQIDILIFSEGNMFNSKNLLSKGYKETQYTLTVESEGAAVWESFQENQEGGVVFWRGELKGKVIEGVVSMLSKNGMSDDLYFSTLAPQESR